ncbi:MAG: hypothetical protein WC966_07820 [Bradymonadales bacterium]
MRKLTVYRGITLGHQDNANHGAYFAPKTGEVVKMQDVVGKEEILAMVAFSANSGDAFLSFPANAKAQVALPWDEQDAIFTAVPGGLDSWEQSKMIHGNICPCDGSPVLEFENLLNTQELSLFDSLYRRDNFGKDAPLRSCFGQALTPSAGKIYIVAFSGTVRAIIRLNTVVKGREGSFTFDMVIESREVLKNHSLANNIQPEL